MRRIGNHSHEIFKRDENRSSRGFLSRRQINVRRRPDARHRLIASPAGPGSIPSTATPAPKQSRPSRSSIHPRCFSPTATLSSGPHTRRPSAHAKRQPQLAVSLTRGAMIYLEQCVNWSRSEHDTKLQSARDPVSHVIFSLFAICVVWIFLDSSCSLCAQLPLIDVWTIY